MLVAPSSSAGVVLSQHLRENPARRAFLTALGASVIRILVLAAVQRAGPET